MEEGRERGEEEEEAIFDLSGVDSDDAISLYLKEIGCVPLLTAD